MHSFIFQIKCSDARIACIISSFYWFIHSSHIRYKWSDITMQTPLCVSFWFFFFFFCLFKRKWNGTQWYICIHYYSLSDSFAAVHPQKKMCCVNRRRKLETTKHNKTGIGIANFCEWKCLYGFLSFSDVRQLKLYLYIINTQRYIMLCRCMFYLFVVILVRSREFEASNRWWNQTLFPPQLLLCFFVCFLCSHVFHILQTNTIVTHT